MTRFGRIAIPFLGACLLGITAGCGDQPVPKPIGYYRIDLPDHAYKSKDPKCPFTFEISEYSRLVYSQSPDSLGDCWFSIAYPKWKARVYLTYKPIEGNDLHRYIEEAHGMVYEHQIKANRIASATVRRDSARVYGLTYELGGEVASPFQFYLTDSTRHFLRGSLYFNARPNPDSIAPVLKYVTEDLDHLIRSIEWE